MTKRGKTNAKKTHVRAAGKDRANQRKSSGPKKSKPLGRITPKSSPKRSAPPARRPASFRLRDKRTFQLTDTEAVERLTFKATKGRKLTSSSSTAKEVLDAGLKRASKKFSRKKSSSGGRPRFAARITLKWKSKNGKWVKRNLVQYSESFEKAVSKLLEHEEINSLTYERFDDGHEGEVASIASKKKKIISVSFDKFVERKFKSGKISKATKAKTRKKVSRNVRYRK